MQRDGEADRDFVLKRLAPGALRGIQPSTMILACASQARWICCQYGV